MDRINLADPDFEPTDAQLNELSARAFADVRAAHDRVLAKLRSDIAAARKEALEAFERRTERKRPGA
jgi:hypothetical protein